MELEKTDAKITEAEKKKELEKNIRYQVACQERAHRIVEKLLDNPVTEECLLDSVSAQFLSHAFRESKGTLNLIRLSVCLPLCLSVCHKNFNISHNF